MSYFLKLFSASPADPNNSVVGIDAAHPSTDHDADPIRVGDVLYRLEVVASGDGDENPRATFPTSGRSPLHSVPPIRDSAGAIDPEADSYGGFCA